MTYALADALAAVDAAPAGPSVGAFFDLDGTLVKGSTALEFLMEEMREIGVRELFSLGRDVAAVRHGPDGDVATIRRVAELLEGRSIEDLEALSRRVFRKRIGATLRPGARELVRAHLRRGHTVAMATAASALQARPVAEDLDIPHLLSTQVEVVDGHLTGALHGPPLWGSEKARAVTAFAQDRDLALAESFGYANGREDLDFLAAVGHPVAVCPDPELAAYVGTRGAPVLLLDDPPSASVRGVMGTLASLGAFNVGVAAAIAGRLISGGRWKAIGPTLASAADLALRLAGVEVRAQGLEHLKAARPAIFVVNHQSNLDPVIAGTLIRHDFTVVGKQEVADDPRAFAMKFLDIALIDRSDTASAKESIHTLVDRIRAGESVVIWPEGTRMPTQRLGPFKKGAFHLALDAGVPVVPIVLRNTGELWPRGKAVIRPGVADVVVLPPVSTEAWSKDTLGDRVEEIRAQFQSVLARWPRASDR